MKKEIEILIEKNKDFINMIEKDLIKDKDDFGNARRLEDYIIEQKKKNALEREQELILTTKIDDYDASDAYQSYLNELDAPREYLEKTYPTFYKHFENRYNKFIDNWIAEVGDLEFDDDLRKKIFIDHCETITHRIKNDTGIQAAFAYINKHGLPEEVKNKVSLIRDAFFQTLDELFDLPEWIIASFTKKQEVIAKELDKWKNKYPKYPVALYERAFKLQKEAKKNKMKITDENAIIKANEALKIINEKEMIGEDGKPTISSYRITKAYSNYWKTKLKLGKK